MKNIFAQGRALLALFSLLVFQSTPLEGFLVKKNNRLSSNLAIRTGDFHPPEVAHKNKGKPHEAKNYGFHKVNKDETWIKVIGIKNGQEFYYCPAELPLILFIKTDKDSEKSLKQDGDEIRIAYKDRKPKNANNPQHRLVTLTLAQKQSRYDYYGGFDQTLRACSNYESMIKPYIDIEPMLVIQRPQPPSALSVLLLLDAQKSALKNNFAEPKTSVKIIVEEEQTLSNQQNSAQPALYSLQPQSTQPTFFSRLLAYLYWGVRQNKKQ